MRQVDRSLTRILRTIFAIGLFDNTYAPTAIPVQEHGAVARAVEDEAITLLKNDDRTLPLDASKIRNLAVIGADLNVTAEPGGAPHVTPTYEVSPIQGIRARVGTDVNVLYVRGNDSVNGANMLEAPDMTPRAHRSLPAATPRLQ